MIELRSTKTKNKEILKDGAKLKVTLSSLNRLPYGFTVKDYGGEASKNIVLSLSDVDDVESFRKIEDEILEVLSKESEEIFKTFMTKEDIFEMYNSNLSDSGFLRIKITPDTRLFDANGKIMNKTIVDGTCSGWDAKCNFIISGVYFMNKRVGLILKAHHIKLYEPISGGCMFMSDSDSD